MEITDREWGRVLKYFTYSRPILISVQRIFAACGGFELTPSTYLSMYVQVGCSQNGPRACELSAQPDTGIYKHRHADMILV